MEAAAGARCRTALQDDDDGFKDRVRKDFVHKDGIQQ
jgi:hypothetical protein